MRRPPRNYKPLDDDKVIDEVDDMLASFVVAMEDFVHKTKPNKKRKSAALDVSPDETRRKATRKAGRKANEFIIVSEDEQREVYAGVEADVNEFLKRYGQQGLLVLEAQVPQTITEEHIAYAEETGLLAPARVMRMHIAAGKLAS